MSNAVHGKASLTEMLSDSSRMPVNPDGTGKPGRARKLGVEKIAGAENTGGADTIAADERDPANTVDFGATLSTLLDQQAAAKASPSRVQGHRGSGTGRSTPTSNVTAASDANDKDPAAFSLSTVTFADRGSKPGATSKTMRSESAAAAASSGVDAHRSSTRSDRFAAFVDDGQLAANGGAIAGAKSGANQIDTESIGDAMGASQGSASATTEEGAPASGVIVDLGVPDSAIAGDQGKQSFSSGVIDDAAAIAHAQITAGADRFAKPTNSAHIDAEAAPVASMPHPAASARSHVSHPSDGTSSAPSSQDGNQDGMNSSAPSNPQGIVATPASVGAAKGALTSQPQVGVASQASSPPQRDRGANSKESSTPLNELAAMPDAAGSNAGAAPVARASEAAAIRLSPDVTSARDSSRTVSITVQLAGGQTAQASVRERAGAVDVKILTPSAASAERVSSEMDGMRHNLDAAGIKLGHSEISYQQGDGGGKGREGYRPPVQNRSANSKEVFIIDEVIQ